MQIKFGNVRRNEHFKNARPPHVARTTIAADLILYKHHFKNVKGEPVLIYDATRLTAGHVAQLIREKNKRALVGWSSYGDNSAFLKLLRARVRAFYDDLEEEMRKR